MSNSNIDERLVTLIEHTTTQSKRFKELEEKTGISSNRWQSVWHKRQRAMPDMIEVVARLNPEFAFWLVTGLSDPVHGHDQPNLNRTFRRRTAARDLFLKEIEEQEWRRSNPWTSEEEEQFHAVEKAHALGSPGPYTVPSIDPDVKERIRHWHWLIVEVEQLKRIREAQEAALSKFEVDEFNKQPLPF